MLACSVGAVLVLLGLYPYNVTQHSICRLSADVTRIIEKFRFLQSLLATATERIPWMTLPPEFFSSANQLPPLRTALLCMLILQFHDFL